ncbi:hypothetical protein D3C81_1610610 [compost metagenome]
MVNRLSLIRYSARVMVTRSVNWTGTVVGARAVGIARWLSTVTCRLAGSDGLTADWPYQLPVELASVMVTGLFALSLKTAVPGGGGAMVKTSCCATTPPEEFSRE